jgi:crotonobetainyl-CoA:carnitine CoA-transferase CaiB-like acyl-CoA transferase
VPDFVLNGRPSQRQGNRSAWPPLAPHGVYRCAPEPGHPAGDDDWLAVAVETDDQWRALADTLGHPELGGEPRFVTLDARVRHQDELDALIESWTRTHTAKDAQRALQAAGIPAGRVQRSRDLYDDPQLAHRGTFPEIDHPVLGRHRVDGMPAVLSRTPAEFRRGGPLLGQDNAYVFGELLGMGEREIARLTEEEVLW